MRRAATTAGAEAADARAAPTLGEVIDTAEFATVVRMDPVPLDLGCALIASSGRPEVDPDEVVRDLDELAATVDAATPHELCGALFGRGTFRGDSVDYYDPRNSLLDVVLSRRIGIPITLSVVGIEVGRRIGVGMVGVGMPGHFLLRAAEDPDRFFDPFHGGIELDRDGCARLFDGLHRGQLRFTPDLLDVTPPLAVLARILNNLRGAQVRAGDRAGVVRALALQCALPGSGVAERIELARGLGSLGELLDAATVHDELAVLDPAHETEHAAAALRLRAQLN